jgi:NapC/NirT cytochrome c family protein/cytochrome c554/c'-like protein
MSHPENAPPIATGRKPWYRRLHFVLPLLLIVAGAALLGPGAIFYSGYSSGQLCASCHEISSAYNEWHASTHRNVACSSCHGSAFSAGLRFHLKNAHRVLTHLRGNIPEQIHLKPDDVQKMTARCRTCHQKEYADWAAGPHAVTYGEIFLNQAHNQRRHLADDCLRCHGMHFEGGIRDLVTATDTLGPWALRDARLMKEPAIPCIACHQLHRQGELLSPSTQTAATQEAVATPSLALFDRRELDSVALKELPLPAMHEGNTSVQISPDPRQALCYQCHAPVAGAQVHSGDDRTPLGVHQGISCFSCHQGHNQKTQASCATCHPQLSNCGLNVATMDTTFQSANSPHDIHSVKCVDCHANGVPKKKTLAAALFARPR